jgi:hypothetical protein
LGASSASTTEAVQAGNFIAEDVVASVSVASSSSSSSESLRI